MDSLDIKQHGEPVNIGKAMFLCLCLCLIINVSPLYANDQHRGVFPHVYILIRPALFLTPQMCFQVGFLMSDRSAEMLTITESSRPVWRNSSLGESKHIIQGLWCWKKGRFRWFLFLFGLGSVPPVYSWNAHWMVSDVFWKTDVGLPENQPQWGGRLRSRLSC